MACDPDLFRMTGQVDLYYWVQDNLTDLCTGSCIQSASSWLEGLHDACSGQTITIDGKMVPTESVAIRYSDGIGLACLTDLYGLDPESNLDAKQTSANYPLSCPTTRPQRSIQSRRPC